MSSLFERFSSKASSIVLSRLLNSFYVKESNYLRERREGERERERGETVYASMVEGSSSSVSRIYDNKTCPDIHTCTHVRSQAYIYIYTCTCKRTLLDI